MVPIVEMSENEISKYQLSIQNDKSGQVKFNHLRSIWNWYNMFIIMSITSVINFYSKLLSRYWDIEIALKHIKEIKNLKKLT